MSDTAFRGLYTVIYQVPDLGAAREWYAAAFGVRPYFDEPYYVGFDVGGYELGLHPGSPEGGTGVVAYWGVGDAEETVERLASLGAEIDSPVRDVGEGIRVATVRDPYGNAVGIIENPHFGKA